MITRVYLVGVITGYIIGMLRVHPIVLVACIVATVVVAGIANSGRRMDEMSKGIDRVKLAKRNIEANAYPDDPIVSLLWGGSLFASIALFIALGIFPVASLWFSLTPIVVMVLIYIFGFMWSLFIRLVTHLVNKSIAEARYRAVEDEMNRRGW